MTDIKIKQIGNLEFQKDTEGEYRYNYPAIVKVKTNEKEQQVTIRINSDKEILVEAGWIQQLVDLGIKLNFDDIKIQYEKDLKIILDLEELTRIEQLKTHWNNSWIHFVKPKIQELDSEIEVNFSCSLDQYIKANFPSTLYLKLTYKGISESLNHRDFGSSRFSQNFKYEIDGIITDYKSRKYKKLETVIAKFKELVLEEKERIEKQAKEKVRKEHEKNKLEKFAKKHGYSRDYDFSKWGKHLIEREKQSYYKDVYLRKITEKRIIVSFRSESGTTFQVPITEYENLETKLKDLLTFLEEVK